MGDTGDLAVLVRAASAGDAAAWNAIVERFTSLLWSVARAHRLSMEDSADVVQNTWLKLLDHLGGIEKPEALPGWLSTTARHECLSMLRKRGRDMLVRDDDLATVVVDVEAAALDAALLEDERDVQLWDCFGRLSERCQRLLRVLMACDRPNYTEVSASLGMPIGSIGPTRMRCLSTLRSLVADTGYAFESGGGRP